MVPFVLFRVATTISSGRRGCDISDAFVSLSVAPVRAGRQRGCGYRVVGCGFVTLTMGLTVSPLAALPRHAPGRYSLHRGGCELLLVVRLHAVRLFQCCNCWCTGAGCAVPSLQFT